MAVLSHENKELLNDGHGTVTCGAALLTSTDGTRRVSLLHNTEAGYVHSAFAEAPCGRTLTSSKPSACTPNAHTSRHGCIAFCALARWMQDYAFGSNKACRQLEPWKGESSCWNHASVI